MPTTDIAAHFGKSDGHVLTILKLASFSPKILKAYRTANLTLEDMMAFTVTDGHEAPNRVFAAITPWQGSREFAPPSRRTISPCGATARHSVR
jgi:hypothetical protein